MFERIFERIYVALVLLVKGPLSKEAVDRVLSDAHKKRPEASDYDKSIVDLLKVLDLDSSFEARKALAADHGIPDYTGTAEQNIRLHELVMRQVANRYVRGAGGNR